MAHMKTIVLTILLVASSALAAKADAGDQPMNVLFLVADDLNSWLLEDAESISGQSHCSQLKKVCA